MCIGGYTVQPRTIKTLFPNLRLLRVEGVNQSCSIEEISSSFGTPVAAEHWNALSFLAICLPPSENVEALAICKSLPGLRNFHIIARLRQFKFAFDFDSDELFTPYDMNAVGFKFWLQVDCWLTLPPFQLLSSRVLSQRLRHLSMNVISSLTKATHCYHPPHADDESKCAGLLLAHMLAQNFPSLATVAFYFRTGTTARLRHLRRGCENGYGRPSWCFT